MNQTFQITYEDEHGPRWVSPLDLQRVLNDHFPITEEADLVVKDVTPTEPPVPALSEGRVKEICSRMLANVARYEGKDIEAVAKAVVAESLERIAPDLGVYTLHTPVEFRIRDEVTRLRATLKPPKSDPPWCGHLSCGEKAKFRITGSARPESAAYACEDHLGNRISADLGKRPVQVKWVGERPQKSGE